MDAWAEYRTVSPALRQLGLACLGAGEQFVTRPGFAARRLDHYALVIVSEGRGWHTADRVTPVAGPCAIWVFPGITHSYRPDATGWAEHWITFAGTAPGAFEELGFWSRAAPVVPIEAPLEEMRAEFTRLRLALRRVDRAAELEAAAAVHRLVAAVSHGRASEDLTIVESIRAAAFSRTQMPELAAAAGLSEHEHREVVRRASGMTPIDLMIKVRLERAQALLADTTLEVRTIARAVGYDDERYFSRLFRARTGHSPSQFRNQTNRFA